MLFNTKETSRITKCTMRQLQYWREQKVIVPTIDATGKGRSIFYSVEDLVALMVMLKLLEVGLDYTEACAALKVLQEQHAPFVKFNKTNRYLLSHDSKDGEIIIKDFSVENIENALRSGQAVIPIWLDQIQADLLERLKKDEKGKDFDLSRMNNESEATTRNQRINKSLEVAGWEVIDYREDLEISSLIRHAVQEYPLSTGIADYGLFVNGLFLGVIEAKRISITAQTAMEQAKRYSRGAFTGVGNWRGYRVPFLYSSNGELVYFLDVREKYNFTRQITNLHTPQGLLELFSQNYAQSYQWLQSHSVAENSRLRDYQREAIIQLETAITQGKRDLLIAMATGTGKTFTIVSAIYRLLASGRVKRVLFLVDRKALAAQTVNAFATFTTPQGNKFNQEYEVYSQSLGQEGDEEDGYNYQTLPSSYLTEPSTNHTFVCVCTIQRMRGNLWGREKIEPAELASITPDIPIHAFDLVIADECHRGYTAAEISVWRATLEYFDGIRIGLTATPASHTVSLFKEIIYRYTTVQAIRDGYLVDYQQINIDSDVRINGTFLEAGEVVATINPETGAQYYEELPDEREFDAKDIEVRITVPDSNRRIIQEVARYAAQHEEETGRFPKILIFASNDLEHCSHADQLVTICKQVFARGDDFVQKITGKVDRPLQKIRELRNRPQPSIAVTVDLLTTGIDIPALEFLVFMRPVKSRILWIQMLGRGTRRCDSIYKTHFKIFDCFGGSLVQYFADSTDFKLDPPRQQTMPLSQIADNILAEVDTEHHLDLLTRRLHRVDRSITPEGRAQLDTYLEGGSQGLAASFWAKYHQTPANALALLEDKRFLEFLQNYPRVKSNFLIAETVEDRVSSRLVINGQQPEDYLDSFYRFVQENSEKIEALRILRQTPQDWNAQVLEDLRDKLRENRFSEENLQKAYQLLHNKALVDIISLIRAAYNQLESVYTATERADRAISLVSVRKELTPEQEEWLGYIREHLIQNLSIELDDFEYAPIFERCGGRNRAMGVFEGELEHLIEDLNRAIAA